MAALTAISWMASRGGVGSAWPMAAYTEVLVWMLAARAEILAGIQYEAILAHLAGGVSVEQVVGADAVQGEAVAGVAVSVGEDRLVAQAGVGAGAAEKIRVNARARIASCVKLPVPRGVS